MKKIYLALLITFTIIGSKLFTIDIPNLGTVSLIMILVIFTILYLIIILSKRKKIYFDKIQKNTAIFLIVTILCAIIDSVIFKFNLLGWMTYIVSFSILSFCMIFINNSRELIFCEKVLLINVFFILVIALYECLTGNYIRETYDSYIYQKSVFGLYKPTAGFANINNLGIFLVIMMPICYSTIDNFKKYKGVVKVIFLLLDIFVVISTNSRGAIIGLIFIFILYYKDKFRKYRVLYNGILIACMMVFVMSVFMNGIIFNDIEDESRINIWKQTIKTIANNYFIGVGPGNIADYNLKADYYNYTFGNPHNYFLEFLGDFGIIAFVCFIGWLYSMIKNCKEITKKDDEYIRSRARNYYIYYIIFIISTITPSTMMTAQYIWLGFGLSIAFLSIYQKEGNKKCLEQKNL